MAYPVDRPGEKPQGKSQQTGDPFDIISSMESPGGVVALGVGSVVLGAGVVVGGAIAAAASVAVATSYVADWCAYPFGAGRTELPSESVDPESASSNNECPYTKFASDLRYSPTGLIFLGTGSAILGTVSIAGGVVVATGGLVWATGSVIASAMSAAGSEAVGMSQVPAATSESLHACHRAGSCLVKEMTAVMIEESDVGHCYYSAKPTDIFTQYANATQVQRLSCPLLFKFEDGVLIKATLEDQLGPAWAANAVRSAVPKFMFFWESVRAASRQRQEHQAMGIRQGSRHTVEQQMPNAEADRDRFTQRPTIDVEDAATSLTNQTQTTVKATCSVCWIEQVDLALAPCGHACLCQTCCSELGARKAWVCHVPFVASTSRQPCLHTDDLAADWVGWQMQQQSVVFVWAICGTVKVTAFQTVQQLL